MVISRPENQLPVFTVWNFPSLFFFFLNAHAIINACSLYSVQMLVEYSVWLHLR